MCEPRLGQLEADNEQDDEAGFPKAPFQAPSPPTATLATHRHPRLPHHTRAPFVAR
jgi:hypothetical protein